MDTTKLDEAIAAAEQANPLSVLAGPAMEPATPASWPEGLPAPGIYRDVSYEDYRAWTAINATALKIMASVTPKHCKAYVDGALNKDTPDRKKGRGFHCACLEPDAFATRFPPAGSCPELLSSGKRKGEPCGKDGTFRDQEANAWYCGTHAKAHPSAVEVDESLSAKDRADIEAMKRAIFAHNVVAMLRQQGGSEVSILWERDGIACKSRIDKLIIDRQCPDTIIDLKKIQPMAGTERALQSSISNYGYDLAAWWYADGLYHLRPERHRPLFAWIFQEDAPPFDVHPVWASKALMQVGQIKADRAFTTYKWCASTGKWPGYCDEIEEIDPSDWEMKRYGLNQ